MNSRHIDFLFLRLVDGMGIYPPFLMEEAISLFDAVLLLSSLPVNYLNYRIIESYSN